MARNDWMTALLDTRRALEEQVTALGERVETSRREITDSVTAQVSELHADNRETRNRVNTAATSLSEINKSLPGLRQDVADLVRTVHELRTTVGDLFARLPESAAVGEKPVQEHALPSAQPEHGWDTPSGAAFPGKPDTAAPVSEETEADGAAVAPSGGPEAESGGGAAISRQAVSEEVANVQPSTEKDSEQPGLTASQRALGAHDVVLGMAATVGTVHLICHRDLWDFIEEHAADVPHFRAPATPSEEGNDRLRITMSGRSVIGVLIAMKSIRPRTAEYGKDDGAWVLSGAVYERLAHDLKTTSRNGTEPLTVTFDDGVGSAPQ
ncbi:hypothetical protein ACFVIM_01530 [Streptomyces sp. NPDC057638]|uniref:hypothetical protein n=1 Tax=Streptomyces sp. NPDC057638 TaxID=3346190 RepID=UPI0036C4E081